MITEIKLNGKIKDYKFEDKHILKPFITRKRGTSEKEFEDIKNAINLRDSKFLEVVVDDFGLKIIDEEKKGFCIKWEHLEEIRKQNNFNITDSDTEDEINAKEIIFDKFFQECFLLVVEAVNSDK